jgi:hypothetical protein
MSLLAFALGGGGQLGVKIFKHVFEYYREKQEIEKLRIQSSTTTSICNANFRCNYLPVDLKAAAQELMHNIEQAVLAEKCKL